MQSLDGKIALITGAAHGMGAVHAERFVAEGAIVVATDVDDAAGAALAARLGDRCTYLHLDVSRPAMWSDVVGQAAERLGPVTVLVNNAGVSGKAVTTLELDRAAYLHTVEIDQHGTLYGRQTVLPGMLEAGGGSIVNISSTAGMVAAPGVNVGYVGAKWAVRGMTKQVAVEYGPRGVRVNSVHPGAIRTPLAKALVDQMGAAWAKDFLNGVPLRRVGEMSEITEVVLFLASDASSFVTGAELVADGGLIQL